MRPRWNRISNTTGIQPKPRHGHRAVAIKELLVIFGGGNEGICDDIFVYNTQTNNWFRPTTKGNVPEGRALFGTVVLDKTRIIVFGGMLEFMGASPDVYELQASRWEWKKLKPLPPPDLKPPPLQRMGHSFTLIDGKIYLFGGLALDSEMHNLFTINPRYLNDLYVLEWENDCPRWKIPVTYGQGPCPRESHSAVAHTDQEGIHKLILFGGMCGFRLGDLYILTVSTMTWEEINTSCWLPGPRSLHSATVVGDQMLVFGGWVPAHPYQYKSYKQQAEWKVTNQLLCLDLLTMNWKDLTNSLPEDMPKARAGHAAAELNGRLYIWSGRDGYHRAHNSQVCCNDLWYLDIDIPPIMLRPQLLKGELKSLEIHWTPVPRADAYILQIQKFDIQGSCLSRKLPLSKSNESDLLPFSPYKPHASFFKESENIDTINPARSVITAPQTSATENSVECRQIVQNNLDYYFRKIPMLPQGTPAAQKIYPNDICPGINKIDTGICSSNLPHPIPTLRPLTMIRISSPRTEDVVPKTFMVNRGTNLIRLTNPMPVTLKSHKIIVKNPSLKLVAVNKDNQIKLVKASCNHLKLDASSISDDSKLGTCLKKPKFNSECSKIDNERPCYAEKKLNESASVLNSLGSGDKEKMPSVVLKPPSCPERAELRKCKAPEGIHLSWLPPFGDTVTAYKVTLLIKEDPVEPKVVYDGVKPECFISKSHLDVASKDEPGGVQAVKFTITARNNKGVGPGLSVKWVLHPSNPET